MLVTGCATGPTSQPSTISGANAAGGGRDGGANHPSCTAGTTGTPLQQHRHRGSSSSQNSSSFKIPGTPRFQPKKTYNKFATTSSPASTTCNDNDINGGGGGTRGRGGGGDNNNMGFLRAGHHHLKAPSAPVPPQQSQHSESFTERFSTMLDHCQKKIRLLQGPSSLFTTLVTKARRKERESPATEQEHKLYLEEAVLERKIPETDLRQLVELPPGLGYQEWLASHTIDFFQHINLVYGTIAEFCTMSGCSDMSGPATRPYLWFDEKGKKVRVAAPQYIDYVMTFTQKTINDESIFPTKFENEFPVSFESIVKKIHRLLFHVIAHLYHSHFRELVLLSLHAHLNCIFAHFTLFNERFRLIDEKETEILHDLVLALRLHPEDREAAAAARQAAEGGEDAPSTSGEDGVRHCTSAAGDGRASPAVASTPGMDAAADEPQSAARLDDPLPSPSGGAASSSSTGPFISPDLADTRP